jgi:hypothetical protein
MPIAAYFQNGNSKKDQKASLLFRVGLPLTLWSLFSGTGAKGPFLYRYQIAIIRRREIADTPMYWLMPHPKSLVESIDPDLLGPVAQHCKLSNSKLMYMQFDEDKKAEVRRSMAGGNVSQKPIKFF